MGQATIPSTEELAAAGLGMAVDGAVVRITIARPERRNAMTGRTWTTLARIGQSLSESVRVVVITGEGATFSSGIDLAMFEPGGVPGEESLFARAVSDPDDTAALDAGIAAYQDGYLWLRRPGIVSIAAVRGHAIGAGFQLALACDIRVLADDAQLCMKEPALGLVPDLTGTKPLVDLVGVNRAIELCLTARTVSAQEAHELRLAERVVPEPQLDAAVADLVEALLATPAEAAAATKALLLQARNNDLPTQARAERTAQIARLRALVAGA
ncbi:enoyl-CoA hydratase/isomerase family protein [Nocardiopsis ansamitocini]|uniref:Enoyl-CoA hydratase n=1 Tax=Nocardiopsis ansamitocini TaxID=1670832 RepID=A0A9W6P8D7_9ACTN|nr:enoyl-CoA hydratase/isomerase family protein [Nocardiopsis ansamitocini]GLU48942.1 enoyl-CoA hydratase [Nocardiopsis ansamitocini]